MKVYLVTLFVFFAFSFSAFSQEWKDELAKELVVFDDGKMKSTDYILITLTNGNSMQVKAYAEASESGFISRDQFVAVFFTTMSLVIYEMLEEAGLTEGDYKMKTIDELIGSPDVEFNCYMGKNGLQLEVKANGEVERLTRTWDDIFE